MPLSPHRATCLLLSCAFLAGGALSVRTRLEGFDGVVRRSGCYLVHVPIRWQGKDEIAVAFHWFVEARERLGEWRPVRR